MRVYGLFSFSLFLFFISYMASPMEQNKRKKRELNQDQIEIIEYIASIHFLDLI